MRKITVFLVLLGALSALPARAVRAESPGVELAQQACTALKQGNPRLSDGIGIVFDKSVARRIVEEAVGRWSACREYEDGFPPFFVGREGSQTLVVRFARTSSGLPRCGSFRGRTIVLYAFAVDRTGRLRSCRSPVDLLAHELGHALGLRDAPEDLACHAYTMSNLHDSDPLSRQVQPEECRAVAERWLTSQEIARDSAPALIAGVD
ncbi:MAG: hypothetical protein GY769_25975 [bacterium]|nr:hypothetical protein [bacterium]